MREEDQRHSGLQENSTESQSEVNRWKQEVLPGLVALGLLELQQKTSLNRKKRLESVRNKEEETERMVFLRCFETCGRSWGRRKFVFSICLLTLR